MRILPFLALTAALVSVAPAVAKDDSFTPIALADPDRSTSARPVQFSLEQREIDVAIDLGRIPGNIHGGGLIGALIIHASDDRQKRMRENAIDKANVAARPLRTSLFGFDVDALALAATRKALVGQDTPDTPPIVASQTDAADARIAFRTAHPAQQLAFVDYRYELSPDFGQIRVIADLTIERAAKPGGQPALIYRQRIVSIAQLPSPSYEPGENATRWSHNGGKLARAAITGSFAQIETMIPHALRLTAAEIASLSAKKREKTFAGGFYGPMIARGEADGILLWVNGLIHVRTAS